jgi:eukaryotic-like serine/threonine-protein kinase
MTAVEAMNATSLFYGYDTAHAIGMTIGNATIVKELARGNMGIVFIAFQQNLKRRIAVKVLPKCVGTEESIRLFDQEAEAVAGLSHPNIVPVYDIGENEHFRYLTMQLVEGIALSAVLETLAKNILPSRRTFGLKTTFSIIRQLLEALGYAHGRGVIHCDIKPENILMSSGGQIPIITDFGISKIAGHAPEVGRSLHGSPLYMAPEQIRTTDIDARADIYAVGVLLFRLLVDRLPLVAGSSYEDILRRKFNGQTMFVRSPSQTNPRLQPEIDSIVAAATANDPQQRYLSCHQFLEALRSYGRKFLGFDEK